MQSRFQQKRKMDTEDEALSALKSRNILLHPQMPSDAMTVIAFSRIYFAHCNTWRPWLI